MTFQPLANDLLQINGSTYMVQEHPQLPGSQIPFGQEGRKAIVYQLREQCSKSYHALKVFKETYRLSENVTIGKQMLRFSQLPGLSVWERKIITRQRQPLLVERFSELEYAVLMPWIEGRTWCDIVSPRLPLTAIESERMARYCADMMCALEESHLAHCDIASSNLVIQADQRMELVDVEDMYAPGLTRPRHVSSGSDGYAHHSHSAGIWGSLCGSSDVD